MPARCNRAGADRSRIRVSPIIADIPRDSHVPRRSKMAQWSRVNGAKFNAFLQPMPVPFRGATAAATAHATAAAHAPMAMLCVLLISCAWPCDVQSCQKATDLTRVARILTGAHHAAARSVVMPLSRAATVCVIPTLADSRNRNSRATGGAGAGGCPRRRRSSRRRTIPAVPEVVVHEVVVHEAVVHVEAALEAAVTAADESRRSCPREPERKSDKRLDGFPANVNAL